MGLVTHDSREQALSRRSCVRSSQPVDPIELGRLLVIQERLQEQKEEERAHRRTSQVKNDGRYRHLPQHAARDFTRTTFQDPLGNRDVRFSCPPMSDRSSPTAETFSHDVGQAHLRSPNRYSFRPADHVEHASGGQIDSSFKSSTAATKQRRASAFPSVRPHRRQTSLGRPFSTADLSFTVNGPVEPEAQTQHAAKKPRVRSAYRWDDRHDWCQRDECDDVSEGGTKIPKWKEHLLSLLRRSETSAQTTAADVSTGNEGRALLEEENEKMARQHRRGSSMFRALFRK